MRVTTDPSFGSIQTKRLIVRRFRLQDAEAFSAYRSDPEVARYQGWDPPFTSEEAISFVASLASIDPGTPGTWFQFAIQDRATDELIGDCGLRPEADEPGLAELGFTLARHHQGKGFAREAITAVLEYAQERLGVREIIAVTDARNSASIALLERLGMSVAETRKVRFKDEWCDEREYRLSAPIGHRPP